MSFEQVDGFSQACQVYHLDNHKSWYDFGNLDLIFKVTQGHS